MLSLQDTSYLVSELRFLLGLMHPSPSRFRSHFRFPNTILVWVQVEAISNMSSKSMTLEERFEALMWQNEQLAKKIQEDTQRQGEFQSYFQATKSISFLSTKNPSSTNDPKPQNRSNPNPLSNRICFKCQGLGHIASDYPNHTVVTLAEWSAMKEEFQEEEKEEDYENELEETQEEQQKWLMKVRCQF